MRGGNKEQHREVKHVTFRADFHLTETEKKKHLKSIALLGLEYCNFNENPINFIGIVQIVSWSALWTTIPHGIEQSDYFFKCVACSPLQKKKNAKKEKKGKSTNSTFHFFHKSI